MSFGQGTQFLRSADSGATYVQVAGLKDFEPPSYSRDSSETTQLDSASAFREFLPGPLIDAGELSLELVWDQDNAQQVLLEGDLEADDNGYYRILYPDGNGVQVDFRGHIVEWGKAFNQGDDIHRVVKLKISGKPTVTVL